MHTFAVILACLMAPLTLAFLLAGFLLLQDFPPADGAAQPRLRDIAAFEPTGVVWSGVAIPDACRNWRKRPGGRRFVYAGVLSLFVLLVALYI